MNFALYLCSATFRFFFILLISSSFIFFSCKEDDEKKIYQEVVWSDEFDGSSIDATKWSFQLGGGGWGNSELQYYTDRPENAKVENDRLTITARFEPNYNGTGSNYTSARIRTKGNADWKYGRMEASIKLPSAQAVWPAFWMLPNTGSWPHTGEIDIMEASNANPVEWNGTIHYFCTPCGNHQYTGVSKTFSNPLSDGFHQYAVEWEPEVIRWYVDGEYMGSQSPSTTMGNTWPFDTSDNFHFLLNVAVGGTYPGQSPVSTHYPVSMEVDYVKVYKR